MKETLFERQQQMMNYLLQGKKTIKDHIVQQGAITVDTRLHIYRNAYQLRLRETIDTDHPVIGVYIGDELFDQMVQQYVISYPSHYRSLRHFCDELPSFLGDRKPFSEHPQIAELARFERLLLTVFDASDAPVIGLSELSGMSAPDWPNMKIQFHPSVRMFESPWNVVSVWQAIKDDLPPPSSLPSREACLLWRNRQRMTEFVHLNSAELCMYREFQQGSSFAQVCEALLSVVPDDELSACAVNILSKWAQHGLIGSLYGNE